MVDALREAHRVLRSGGLLIDARPDSRRLARVEHVAGGRRRAVGTVNTARDTLGDDRASDRAIARVVREGLFRSRRAGRLMHRIAFPDLREMQAYLDDHLRLVKRVRWSVDAATRRRWRNETFSIERPVRYELLERLRPENESRLPGERQTAAVPTRTKPRLRRIGADVRTSARIVA